MPVLPDALDGSPLNRGNLALLFRGLDPPSPLATDRLWYKREAFRATPRRTMATNLWSYEGGSGTATPRWAAMATNLRSYKSVSAETHPLQLRSLTPPPRVIGRREKLPDDCPRIILPEVFATEIAARRYALQLHDAGHAVAAEQAEGVAGNAAMAGRLLFEAERHPTFVIESTRGPGMLVEVVLSLAREGLSYVRAFTSLRERESRFLDVPGLLRLLRHAAAQARLEHELLQARWLAGSRELKGAETSDAPHRALPRETRAGPADEDPEESPAAPSRRSLPIATRRQRSVKADSSSPQSVKADSSSRQRPPIHGTCRHG